MTTRPAGAPDAPQPPGAAFATFRPRRGRAVALGAAVVVALTFALGAFLLPGPSSLGQWRVGDRLILTAFGLVLAWFLLRYASIRAVPTRETLTVRNILTTRTLEWSEIVGVQFAGGDPWVRLDLADTEVLAVMAIQKSDGAVGRAEAARLAALVQGLGESAPDRHAG